ncbi:unnamed protein product, partial [Symbiodinium sp. CCMP2592]
MSLGRAADFTVLGTFLQIGIDGQRLVHINVKPASDQLRQICLSQLTASDQEIGRRLPQLAERVSSRICSECKQRKDQALFSRTEWAKKDSVSRCLECKPVDANLQKRAKNSKVCAGCNVGTPRAGFTKTQWAAGVKSKCPKCVETAALEQCKLTKTCETHDQLVQRSVQSLAAADPDGWRKNFHLRMLGPDHGGIPAKEKVALLQAAHEDCSHTGGRHAVIRAMKEVGKTWNNIALDGDWIVRRCELCRSNSTREMGKADVRHLPTPLHSGDVIGWDLKAVTPHDEPKWSMLLALDFTSGKTWTWALDFGEATAVKVQELMLKFYADNELPAICWTDNGGQFRNLLTTAIEATLGVRPRTIPPGRPQANGLVECHNRLLDLAHAGQRSRLLAATVAVNSRIHQRYGVSPESLWRSLRPTESRWKNLQLRGIMHGEAKPISEADWLRFLDESQAGLTPEYVQQATEALHKVVAPIAGALNNKKMREAMKRHLRYARKRTHRSTMPLMSGHRVIARNSQYTTKTGRGKFETLGGEVREFTILSVSQGFVSLKDNKTGHEYVRYEASLKLMPIQLEADDTVMADGGCLYRALHMGMQLRGGIAAEALQDDDAGAQSLRSQVCCCMQKYLDSLTPGRLRQVTEAVCVEPLRDLELASSDAMSDNGGFNWGTYFAYAMKPRTYGTFCNLAAFVRMSGIPIEVYSWRDGLELVWTENNDGAAGGRPIALLRGNVHFDLLALKEPGTSLPIKP